MDCMSNDDIRSVVLKKSARVGYTKMVVAAIGYYAEHKRRNQCVWQPVDGDADDFVKDEIDPMLRDCPAVQAVFPYYNKRCKQNTLSKKCFRGSTLDIKGGKSAKNYRRMTKAVIYLDELSGFDPNISKEGSARTLARTRLVGAAYPKEICGSTPKVAGSCQITQAYDEAGAKFAFKVPCPHCGHRQELHWGGPEAAFGFKWIARDPDTAQYLCAGPACGALWTYEQYLLEAMPLGRWEADDGRWLDDDCGVFRAADGEVIDAPSTVGLHIWAAYSPQYSWREMVSDWLACGKDPAALQTFVNTVLGECWEEDDSERSPPEVLEQRREPYAQDAAGNGDVPDGVQEVVVGIDGQDDRAELQFDGYGFGEERWTLDYVRIFGDPSRSEFWDQVAKQLRRTFVRRDGTVLQVSLACIDSGGHYTDEVYAFSRRLGRKFVVPIKGASEYGQPIAKFPRKPNAHRVYLTMVGSDTAKTLLFQRYQITTPGPGCIHWPQRECFDSGYFQQVCAPERVRKYKKGVAVYTWDSKKRRDEASDCSVYSLAAIRIRQQHFGLRFQAPVAGAAAPVVVKKTAKRPQRGNRSSGVSVF